MPRFSLFKTLCGIFFLRLYFVSISYASLNVVLSKYVGADAIADKSSPITSDITNDTASHERFSTSLPPFILERCFLTQFISCIFAPDFNNMLVTIFLSFSDMPSGNERSADPPPDIKNIINSSGSLFFKNSTIWFVACTLCLFGIG